jgi:ribosomal protein S6
VSGYLIKRNWGSILLLLTVLAIATSLNNILTYLLARHLALSTAAFTTLTNIVKKISHEIVDNGGIVRAVHNHGIRDLPHRFRAKYPDRQGNRYFTKGRFFSLYYDCNPTTMRQVEQLLSMEEDVLRKTHLRARSPLDAVNNMREKRNPYIQEVLKQEEIDRIALAQRNETVEQVIDDMRHEDV